MSRLFSWLCFGLQRRKLLMLLLGVSCGMLMFVIIPSAKVNTNGTKETHKAISTDLLLEINPAQLFWNPLDKTISAEKPDSSGIPKDFLLNQMAGQVLSSFYYRYINTLQILCPRKDIFGGIFHGLYVCLMPTHAQKCNVFFVNKENTGESRFVKDMREIHHCTSRQLLKGKVEKALKDENSSKDIGELLMKDDVDVLAITTGTGDTEIVRTLQEKGYLKRVQQLIFKTRLSPTASNDTEIRQMLSLLRLLHGEGFFIYHKERSINCIYRLWNTACHTIYMVRNIPVPDPIVLPTSEEIDKMSLPYAYALYHRYLISTQILCSDVVRIGHIKDGGWDICNDTTYRPVDPCLVYSFGIANDWTFDDKISRNIGCQVHSFDPSIGKQDHQRSPKISFHNLGISDHDGKLKRWDVKTLSSIIKMLGHTNKTIDIVKMDVEGSEWQSIPQMLDSKALSKVRQLYFEFHFPLLNATEGHKDRLKMLRGLYDQGMRIFWSHPNQVYNNIHHTKVTNRDISCCYEVYFVNVNLN